MGELMDKLSRALQITIADTVIRIAANLSIKSYYFAKWVVETYRAKDYMAVTPDDDTIMSDTESLDTRTPITGALAIDILYVCNALVSWCENPEIPNPLNPNPRFAKRVPLDSIIKASTVTGEQIAG